MTRESNQHPQPLLQRTPEAAVRLLALELLDTAAAAAADFSSDDHSDDLDGALHRFRVSLRRLRTLFQAYREHLPRGVSKKRRRALHDLARSTGDARDAEVELEWLVEHRTGLDARAGKACAWLAERVEARRDGAYAEIRDEALADFVELEARLRRALARDGSPAAYRSFARTAARRIQRAGAALAAVLPELRAATDVATVHDARIRAKRVRYLVEPLEETPMKRRAVRLVRSLKELQDGLGELHDLHVLAAELGTTLVSSAAARARDRHDALYAANGASPRADLGPGLLALDRRVRDEIERRFGELCARWDGEEIVALAGEIEALAGALRHRGESSARRVERGRRRALAARRP